MYMSYVGAPACVADIEDTLSLINTDKYVVFSGAGLPFVKGKTWTTDAVHRETRDNFEKRKKEGCISVEM